MPDKLVLIDTSVWIFALRKNSISEIRDRVNTLLAVNAVAIVGIIKLELLGGVKTEDEFQRLRNRLDTLQIIETNARLWDKASVLAYELRRKGLTVPSTDILIAATALQTDATVLHADHHFDKIAARTSLQVESYASRLSRVE
jgi:hypothetical protein